ncbi:MAG: hypothetical protein Greene071436_258 [Parcubacteria group bacterium Greene0714_36]|nr:MAG: hypothetical protein Greene071436_258 [Parcubacteria group bacterium Greene0714_36]
MIYKTIIILVVGFIALVIVIPLILSAVGIDILSGTRGSAQSGGLLFRSKDGGEHWEPATFVRERRDPTPSYIYDVVAHPVATTTLFAGTKGAGLWKSEDAGMTWRQIKDTAGVMNPRSDIYRVAISKSKPDVMYVAAFQENRGRVFKSTDGGASFRQIYFVGRDKYGVFDIATPPADPDTIMAATGEGRLLVSNDGGERWHFSKVLRDPLARLVLHPGYSNEGYLMTSRGQVLKTYDGGISWTDLGILRQSAAIREGNLRVIEHPYSRLAWFPSRSVYGGARDMLVPDPYQPGVMYRTNKGNLLKSADGGATWARFSTFIDGLGVRVGGIAVHPRNQNTLMVTAGQAVYTSRDLGINWSIVPFDKGSELREVYIHPDTPNVMFVVVGR